MSISAIQSLIPPERIQKSPEEAGGLGNYGEYIVFPQSEDEIATILKYASENALTVIPEGAGTKRGYGGLEEKADILLSLKQYRGIVEYSEGDMTMTVRAGTTIAEIQEFLQPYQQMLPLDPFWPTHATFGGVMAANDSGPKRLRYGSARDLVIGTRIVYPDGGIIRTGGKVVKNVAGYDMNKLFIGAMGTLAVVTDITVKLRPLPKYRSLALIHFPSTVSIRPFAVKLLDSNLEPVSLELLNPTLAESCTGKSLPTLAIAFEDVEKAVRYQENWLQDNLPKEAAITTILRQEEASKWWGEFAKLPPIGAAEDQTDIAIKLGSRNLEVIPILQQAEQIAQENGVMLQAHGGLGHGLSKLYVKGTPSSLSRFVQKIRTYAEQQPGGYAILQHAPLSLRQEVDPWGAKPAYFPLLAGIKRTIDPQRVLNPSRFIGGI